MADFNQFGSAQHPQTSESEHCARCEAMLADALDGTLSAADQAAFDLHMISCSACSAMLADAQRGADWLAMLKSPRPEPSAALLDRILAQTCNAQPADPPQLVAGKQRSGHGLWQPSTLLGHGGPVPVAAMQPAGAYSSSNVLPFRSRVAAGFRLRSIGQTLLQPRLAMTAAMAFFSVALTLNITGVRVSQLHLSDLRPSSIKHNLYEANAHVLRYYDNLKVVYELESRVRDLQRSSNNDAPYIAPAPAVEQDQQPSKTQPGSKQKDDQQPASPKSDSKQSHSKPGPGSSRRETSSGNVQLAEVLQRPDSIPATQALVVFTPSILKYLQEGELV